MSLKEKWEEYRNSLLGEYLYDPASHEMALLRAFYAGAESADKIWDEEVTFGAGPEVKSMRIEIDHFKNKRATE